MTRPPLALRLSCCVLLVAGCSQPDPKVAEPVEQVKQPVQLSRLYSYYDVSLSPFGTLAAAQRATGTVFVPIHDSSGVAAKAADGTALRYSCGVTFISPYHAITAAHCVDAIDVPNPATDTVSVQMYRLSPSVNWLAASALSGTFPGWTHPDMTTGYDTDHYTCRVVMRCGTAYGKYACDHESDIAMLQCLDAPGETYGYLEVAASDQFGWLLRMPWAHEVYDVDRVADGDRYYTQFPHSPVRDDNFHYFGADVFGHQRNQLIQLQATRWPGFVERVRTGAPAGTDPVLEDVQWTDLLGCHGTSGSGILQRNPTTSRFELLGPAVAGNWLGLCADQSKAAPGVPGLGYTRLATTQEVASHANLCEHLEKTESPALWMLCHREFIKCRDCLPVHGPISDPWPFPWEGPGGVYERNRIWDEPTVRLSSAEAITVSNTSFVPGTRYRVSMRVIWPNGTQAPRMNLRLAGSQVLMNVAPSIDPSRSNLGVLSGTFVAQSAGQVPLEVEVAEQGRDVSVNDIAVVAEGRVADFDTEAFRRTAGLVSGGNRIEPMRFTGDGVRGFAALLGPGERMVLNRQAFVANRAWLTSFRASGGNGGLDCGLMYANGDESRVACTPNGGTFVARSFSPTAGDPVGFFVEAAAGGTASWSIDDVSLESCSTACGAPANARATCAQEVCDFVCAPGFVRQGGACVPQGDTCGLATDIDLSAPAVDLHASTVGAAHNVNATCVGSLGADVFYRFTLSRPELVYADTFGANWDTVLFFANANCGAVASSPYMPGGLVECNDDAPSAGCTAGGAQSQVLGYFQPGTYYLALQGYGAATGEATIHFRHVPVGNNGASSAPWPSPRLLGAGASTVSGFTAGTGLITTSAVGLTSPSLLGYQCGEGGLGPENTYFWRTCPGDTGGTFHADTCSGQTGADTYLYVATPGSVMGNDCNDDTASCVAHPTSSTLARPGGGPLQIPDGAGVHVLVVDSYSASSGGSYVLNVSRP
jgi:hypothetical protein